MNLRATFVGEAQESQAAGFSRLVHPSHFAPGLDAFPKIQRKPKMNWSALLNGGKRFKAQAAFGDVQYCSTVIPFQLQEYKLIRHVSRFFATFQVYISQGHVSREARLIFGTSFSGGERRFAESVGPGRGMGPSLLAPRPPLYSSVAGLKLAGGPSSEKNCSESCEAPDNLPLLHKRKF